MNPELEFVFELNADLSHAVDVGATPYGFRRVIQIHTGTFAGPSIQGTLLPGEPTGRSSAPTRSPSFTPTTSSPPTMAS